MASEGASWGEEGYEATQGAQDQHSDEQLDNFAQDSHVSGDAADNGTEEDGGDYDPESVTIGTPSQVPEKVASATPSQQQPSKPKMSGGFLVEASDDEDEAPANVSTQATSTNSQTQAPIPTPSPQVNAGALSVPPSVPSNVTPAINSLDPVALLEARVKEDPRGDMDAWLNLIADHRRNSRLNEARSTYNRFLDVFPQAVSKRTYKTLM